MSRPRIVALGDSLTAGLGLAKSEAYPAVLERRLRAAGYDAEVVNAGLSGDTSAGALRRLDWSLDGDVRILIVALGGNDGLRGLSVEDMKGNLSAMVERAQARGIAALDIGQSIAVKQRSVVAVEAMEGTDAMIERAGEIAGPGIVIAKVAKPKQDARFDVPIVGLATIERLVAARAGALAFPGGEVLFFDQPEAIALAEKNRITILAV